MIGLPSEVQALIRLFPKERQLSVHAIRHGLVRRSVIYYVWVDGVNRGYVAGGDFDRWRIFLAELLRTPPAYDE